MRDAFYDIAQELAYRVRSYGHLPYESGIFATSLRNCRALATMC